MACLKASCGIKSLDRINSLKNNFIKDAVSLSSILKGSNNTKAAHFFGVSLNVFAIPLLKNHHFFESKILNLVFL